MRRFKNLESLKNQITATRAKMNEIWNQRGYTDSEVLAVSIQLDHLINQYQQITYSKK